MLVQFNKVLVVTGLVIVAVFGQSQALAENFRVGSEVFVERSDGTLTQAKVTHVNGQSITVKWDSWGIGKMKTVTPDKLVLIRHPRKPVPQKITPRDYDVISRNVRERLGAVPVRSSDEMNKQVYKELEDAEFSWAMSFRLPVLMGQLNGKKEIAEKLTEKSEREYWTNYYQGIMDRISLYASQPALSAANSEEHKEADPRQADQREKRVRFNSIEQVKRFNADSIIHGHSVNQAAGQSAE